MKKVSLLLGVCCAALVPCRKAQEPGNIQVGAFADYDRSEATGTNMFGAGGRLGFGILPHTLLEGEVAYDFSQEYTSGFNNNTNGSISFYTPACARCMACSVLACSLDMDPCVPSWK